MVATTASRLMGGRRFSTRDYMVPVNADVPSIEIIMVPEKDERVNPLGVKGIGEVCIVGVNAAVADAVVNAGGKRARDLPIRPEALL